MGIEWLAIIMFALFLVLLLSGYPVAFSFAGTAIVFAGIGIALDAFNVNSFGLLFNRWFSDGVASSILLAIPYFVFMGAMFEKSGLAERLLTTIGMLMGRVRGGIAITVILVGALLGAATGVVAATIIVMGLISLRSMVDTGYDHKVASGVIVGAGTMAQLLPPSLVLIVLATVVPVRIGDLFIGALIPGMILTGLYVLYVVWLGFRSPEKVPPLPESERTMEGSELARETLAAVIPPLLLIFAVLGSIFFGIATATEAGTVGAVGATILAALGHNFTKKVLLDAAQQTVNITALVMMILFASTFFGLVFDQLGGQDLAKTWLTNLPGGWLGFLIISQIIIFVLGINLEFLEISFIAMPILFPSVIALGIDPVWFLVISAINLNMAFVSPPVGFSLFYLQSVKPDEVKTKDIHLGAIPVMGLQAAALIIVLLFPQTVTFLIDRSEDQGGVEEETAHPAAVVVVLD